MSSDTIIILELAITLGVVLAFGFWELRSLKKDTKDGEQEESE